MFARFAFTLFLLLCAPAFAQTGGALIFRKDSITILPTGKLDMTEETQPAAKAQPEIPTGEKVIFNIKDKKKDSAEAKTEATPPKENPAAPAKSKGRQPLNFSVQIRPEKGALEGINAFSIVKEDSGVMTLLDKPIVMPLINMNITKPMDVLFVENDGTILQIVPNVVLASLQEDIYPQSAIRGFLFLKGGTCDAKRIIPGDQVEHPLFNKRPVILQ